MKEPVSCSLTGAHWWKPFLFWVLISSALFLVSQSASNTLENAVDPEIILSSLLFIIVLSLISTTLQSIFSVLLSRIALPQISFSGKAFSFTGKTSEYAFLTLKCTLLMFCTLGLYLPWYYTRLLRYYMAHVEYEGTPVRFEGKPGALFKYFILGLLLPLIAWVIAFSTVFVTATQYQQNNYTDIANTFFLLSGFVWLAIIPIIIPFFYYLYKWMVNFTWKGTTFSWNTNFWQSVFFITGQILLSIITLGIYIPGAMLSLWEHFAYRTVITKNGQPAGSFIFSRQPGGFAYLWKQILLSIVTLGIYTPWAYANSIRYFLNLTAVHSTEEEPALLR